MLEQIIPFLTASILLTISPGPDIIYVLVQSISNGKKAGLVTTLGLVSGILVHTSLVAFGVSAVIKQSETLFGLIKIFGALYLFYLAYKVFRGKAEFSLASKNVEVGKKSSLFKQGFIMNVMNPKVTIFFLAFFPGFLWDPEGSTIYQFYLLGFVFMLQTLLIFGLVALLAGKISVYLKRNPSSGVFLKWLQIVVFILIGVLILI
jgi:threonine/homoserine/homoserine lactone efflux protein